MLYERFEGYLPPCYRKDDPYKEVAMYGIGIFALCALGIIAMVLFARAAKRTSRETRLEEYRETLPLLHIMVFDTDAHRGWPPDQVARGPLMDALRNRACAIIGRWTQEDILHLASFVSHQWLDGEVPEQDVAAFFIEERDLIRADPAKVSLHISRFSRRFRPSHEGA